MILLFASAIFVGAALIFTVEPMAAKTILPLLGGSPAVWNTAVVFFQACLLAGYLGAHLLGKAGRRTQVAGYALALAAPIAASALLGRVMADLPPGWRPPTDAWPVPWALGLLAVMIGGPFVVLAGAAPLLQRWFSGTGHRRASDPYFLYIASNAGSMLGLLAYPFLIEPTLTLPEQRWAWTIGFGVFAVLAAACGVAFQRSGPAAPTSAAPAATPSVAGSADRPTWARRALWVALALVPSSLMLGVTQYLSTDIAAVPLLWVLPLGIYLLSFILAFTGHPAVATTRLDRLIPIMMVALAVVFVVRGFRLPTWALFSLHLLGLLMLGLYCHAMLAESRPSARRLTEFYLWIAVGGVLGGAFNALAAPLMFPIVVEYPLMVVLACLFRIRSVPRGPAENRLGFVTARVLDVAWPLLAAGMLLAMDQIARRAGIADGAARLGLSVGIPVLLLYFAKMRPVRFAATMGAIVAVAFLLLDHDATTVRTERTFFGVYRIKQDAQMTVLTHGTTLHGLQWRDERRGTPMSYYHPEGPIGRVFEAYQPRGLCDRVGIVGLGSGALAAYGRSEDWFTFHEIDPLVEHLAADPRYFTYLTDTKARWNVVIGDGRLTLRDLPDGEYGLLVLDAFSSDSIPVHLLTREAMALYLSKIRPGGLVAFHVSNQFMDLAPVVGRIAQDLGATALEWNDQVDSSTMTKTGHYTSVWVVVAQRAEDLAPLRGTAPWAPPKVTPATPLWTDDYSNIVRVLRAR